MVDKQTCMSRALFVGQHLTNKQVHLLSGASLGEYEFVPHDASSNVRSASAAAPAAPGRAVGKLSLASAPSSFNEHVQVLRSVFASNRANLWDGAQAHLIGFQAGIIESVRTVDARSTRRETKKQNKQCTDDDLPTSSSTHATYTHPQVLSKSTTTVGSIARSLGSAGVACAVRLVHRVEVEVGYQVAQFTSGSGEVRSRWCRVILEIPIPSHAHKDDQHALPMHTDRRRAQAGHHTHRFFFCPPGDSPPAHGVIA